MIRGRRIAKFAQVAIALPLLAACSGYGRPPVWTKSFEVGANDGCDRNPWWTGLWIADQTLLSYEEAALVARNPRDGAEIWRYGRPGFCFQTLRHTDRDVVVLETRQRSGSRRERDYFVTTLDLRDGRVRWQTQLPDEAWSGTVAAGESMIFVLGRIHWDPNEKRAAQNPNSRLPGGHWREAFAESIHLHELNREDGVLRWSASVGSGGEDNPVTSTEIALGPGYALISKNTIHEWGAELFDTNTGARRWEIPLRRLGNGNARVSLLDDSRFAVIDDGTLEHRSIDTGERIETIEPAWDRPYGVAGDRQLYSYSEGVVEAFSIENGRRVWRHSFGIKRDWWGSDRGYRQFSTQGDRLSVGVGDGCVYVIDSRSGGVEGRLYVWHHLNNWPAILSGDLIIVNRLGFVAAYEPRFLDCRTWFPF